MDATSSAIPSSRSLSARSSSSSPGCSTRAAAHSSSSARSAGFAGVLLDAAIPDETLDTFAPYLGLERQEIGERSVVEGCIPGWMQRDQPGVGESGEGFGVACGRDIHLDTEHEPREHPQPLLVGECGDDPAPFVGHARP